MSPAGCAPPACGGGPGPSSRLRHAAASAGRPGGAVGWCPGLYRAGGSRSRADTGRGALAAACSRFAPVDPVDVFPGASAHDPPRSGPRGDIAGGRGLCPWSWVSSWPTPAARVASPASPAPVTRGSVPCAPHPLPRPAHPHPATSALQVSRQGTPSCPAPWPRAHVCSQLQRADPQPGLLV